MNFGQDAWEDFLFLFFLSLQQILQVPKKDRINRIKRHETVLNRTKNLIETLAISFGHRTNLSNKNIFFIKRCFLFLKNENY